MKNTKFLLPSNYKKAGWWILGITLALIVVYFSMDGDLSINYLRELFGMEPLESKA